MSQTCAECGREVAAGTACPCRSQRVQNTAPPPKVPARDKPDDWLLALVIGILYLTFCSGVGGGVYLFWAPRSIFARFGLAVAVVVGLVVALVARIPDPAARPIRWGLLWLALGFVAGSGAVFGGGYLYVYLLGWPLLFG